MFKKRASDDQIHIELGQEDQSFFFHPAADPLRITSREVYQEFQPSYDIVGWGLFGPEIPCTAPVGYTAQTLILHQQRAHTQFYRTRLIKSSRLKGLTATLEWESPFQVLTEINVA